MKQLTITKYAIILMLILAVILSLLAYYDTIYRLDRANAWLSRAETAGFAEEMVSYILRAKELLPKEGNPVWIFPTDRTDFTKINKDIDTIIDRANILKTLPKNSDAYQQGMDDLRGKLRTLQVQIAEAAPFMFVSPINIALALIWFLIVILLAYYAFKLSKQIMKPLYEEINP
jgi:hypothetical protein